MFIKVKWSKGEIQDGKRLIEKRRKVLVSANDLFSELGYENTTMAMISQKTGISLISLLFLYSRKQKILDALVGHHLDVHAGIRAVTRTNPANSPLTCFRKEWDLTCEYMTDYGATLIAFSRNKSHCASWIQNLQEMQRLQDVELLDKACAIGELPTVNVVSLESVLRGTLWHLVIESAEKEDYSNFSTIPTRVKSLVLDPLMS